MFREGLWTGWGMPGKGGEARDAKSTLHWVLHHLHSEELETTFVEGRRPQPRVSVHSSGHVPDLREIARRKEVPQH